MAVINPGNIIYTNALDIAGLSMNYFPTLKKWWENAYEREKKRKEKLKRKMGGRLNAYLYIKFSQLWLYKIHSVIKNPQKPHGLKWLRLIMSYHRLPNLG